MYRPDMLYKTTIIIWTESDPAEETLEALAYAAEQGEGFCSFQGTEEITDASQFPNTEFFGVPEE